MAGVLTGEKMREERGRMGAALPEAQEYLGLPEAGGSEDRSSPRGFWVQPCPEEDFEPPEQ